MNQKQISKESIEEPQILFNYVIIGRLIEFDAQKNPIIEINHGNQKQICRARSCVKLSAVQLGADVILVMTSENNPIITGVIETEPVEVELKQATVFTPQNTLAINGQLLNLKATECIRIECGEASITLTKEGKITIKSKHILSRAKKVNRIQGGSVELN
jgi:hypothetical protein